MKENPFEIEQRLTSELFDHYVAKARAERAKAISAFMAGIVAWLAGLPARIQRAGRNTGQRSRLRGSETVRP